MTVNHSLSNDCLQHVGEIADSKEIRRFISDNADDLIRVAKAAGGFNAGAAATDLVASVLSDTTPADLVRDMLIFVRDTLQDSSGSVGRASAFGRPDVDAAIRWHGARLDDLIRDQAQTPTSG